ncbi:hypothetical protein FQN57_004732 [Myotisia sp. PD_48]|nr:hypothetical protein FQN57_004732 [Myotisia sp. PD_48]
MSSSLQANPQPNSTQFPGQFITTSPSLRPPYSQSLSPQLPPSRSPREDGSADYKSSSDAKRSNPSSINPSAMNSPREPPIVSPSRGSPATGSNPATPRLMASPPIPPPRTSSNKGHIATAEGSRPAKRRGERGESGRRRGDRERADGSYSSRDRAKDDMTSPVAKSRRKAPHSPEGPQRAASTREPREHPSATALESRSEAAMGPSSVPTGLTKEGSAVLQRTVITDPEVDIAREQQRQQINTLPDAPNVSGLGVSNDGQHDDTTAKNRHDGGSGAKRKETSFGDYILGQTLGEGEFGKVRLGWKRDGSVQVAIKMIRRESLGTNPSRLPKINREISILQRLSHPNIVRIHEIVNTERHIGIILEYASGGELFDYILNHRYLKDNPARRLFAQLVSGVGYLHKLGIVHRDLKLENLLLDRNRNIIITDFGFANNFNPSDDLTEEIEYNLTNREFVKQMGLNRLDSEGLRRGDLMQTSCGSPCYAAPELVVSDSLYTGRKVDVWSCGVILYAMLAGYLPFDDDPANPDGDNINLLYKYIVTTPLTFPEYVTPHARDLLRRILVPDPRKRADLFEVARHSWLAEYASVVSHITSNTTNVSEIANTTVPSEEKQESPVLERSASVREPMKPYSHNTNTNTIVGGLTPKQDRIAQADDKSKRHRDAKRRTVQLEYVPPQSSTTRGDSSSGHTPPRGPRPISNAPISHTNQRPGSRDARDVMVPLQIKQQPLQPTLEPAGDQSGYNSYSQTMARPKSRDVAQSMSELTGSYSGTQGAHMPSGRPQTGGSMASMTKIDSRLPSRGSYSQPVAPAVAPTTAQGRLAQPKDDKGYNISAPIPVAPNQIPVSIGQPSTHSRSPTIPPEITSKGHKRSSTVTSLGEKIFGKTGSIFGGRASQPGSPRIKPNRRYPPTSMKGPVISDEPRPSMDSRLSISHAFRKQGDAAEPGRSRRFSLLLTRAFSSSKDQPSEAEHAPTHIDEFLQSRERNTDPERRLSTAPAIVSTAENPTLRQTDPRLHQGQQQDTTSESMDPMNYPAQIDRQFATLHSHLDEQYRSDALDPGYQYTSQPPHQSEPSSQNGHRSHQQRQPQPQSQNRPPPGYQYENTSHPSMQGARPPANSNVLRKGHRKFGDPYETEKAPSHNSGSSGAARKVMDFFRRRGKARTGEDR